MDWLELTVTQPVAESGLGRGCAHNIRSSMCVAVLIMVEEDMLVRPIMFKLHYLGQVYLSTFTCPVDTLSNHTYV